MEDLILPLSWFGLTISGQLDTPGTPPEGDDLEASWSKPSQVWSSLLRPLLCSELLHGEPQPRTCRSSSSSCHWRQQDKNLWLLSQVCATTLVDGCGVLRTSLRRLEPNTEASLEQSSTFLCTKPEISTFCGSPPQHHKNSGKCGRVQIWPSFQM